MAEIAVHEHIGDYLPGSEIRSLKVVQPEYGIHVNTATFQYNFGKEKQPINNKQILNNWWQNGETTRPDIGVHLGLLIEAAKIQ